MTSAEELRRAHALIDEFWGPSDPAADRAVEVMNAHAAALAWVRDTTGRYPAPPSVAAEIERVSWPLRTGEDDRDPNTVLHQTAVEALAGYQASVVP